MCVRKAMGLTLLQGLGGVLCTQPGAEACSGLSQSLALPNTTVYSTTFVSAGTNLTIANNPVGCNRPSQVADVDVCRVSMLYETGPTSNVTLEAWLPFNWTGRFLGVGNGGLGGCIYYEDINYGALHGFATIGSNNGHDGNTGLPFYKNPGVVEDFAYRAIHSEAVIGKQVVEAFYGREADKSYYLGCSTGGRQGFKEAQSFPEDFDGIVAGAPAFAWNDLLYWSGLFLNKTGNATSPKFLTSAQWDLVYADILAQCDERVDGVADTVIEDPDLCPYRPEALICGAGNSTSNGTANCLTSTQVETVRNVFSPVYGPQGQLIFPRPQPGANATARVFNGLPYAYASDWFRYVVYNDTTWDVATIDLSDWQAATDLNPFNIQTFEGDLSAVRDRGSKILHYHGLQDDLISSENSARYYAHVSQTMGATYAELDEFYRYFRISGLGHCNSGTGANFIGNKNATDAGYAPESNVLAAIVAWVEDGEAPESILGTKYTTGANGTTTVDYQRRHCKYPARNTWDRQGDPKDPHSWECL